MTNKKIFQMLALAAFAAMVMIAPLQAAAGSQQQGEPKRMIGQGCMAGPGRLMLNGILGLSSEQKAKIEALYLEHQKEMIGLRAELAKRRLEMRPLMKDPTDVRKIEAKIDELAKMRSALQKRALSHRLAVRALLTDAQKAKLGEAGCGMGGSWMHGDRCGMNRRPMRANPGLMRRQGPAMGVCKSVPECQEEAREETK